MKKLSRRVLAEYFVRSLRKTDSVEGMTKQLAAYLLETRRTSEADLIVRDIQTLLANSGNVIGTVTTAFAIDSATRTSIEKSIQQQTGASSISLTSMIDPSVLGGYKVSIPGKEIDQTVATQLTTLKTQFRKG